MQKTQIKQLEESNLKDKLREHYTLRGHYFYKQQKLREEAIKNNKAIAGIDRDITFIENKLKMLNFDSINIIKKELNITDNNLIGWLK